MPGMETLNVMFGPKDFDTNNEKILKKMHTKKQGDK